MKFSRLAVIVAVSILLALIASLLFANYRLSRNTHHFVLERIQNQVEERSQSISQLLILIKYDLVNLTSNPDLLSTLIPVSGLYDDLGRHPELSSVLNQPQFKPLLNVVDVSKWGLFLVSEDQRTESLMEQQPVLARAMADWQRNSRDILFLDDALLIRRSIFHERWSGYLVVIVPYSDLYPLYSHTSNGGCVLFNAGRLVYPVEILNSAADQGLEIFKNNTQDYRLLADPEQRINVDIHPLSVVSNPAIFYSDVPGTPLTLAHIEELPYHLSERKLQLLAATMFSVSAGIIGFALLLVRARARHQVIVDALEQRSILENQRQEALDELKFLIEGTGIGVWSWDVTSGAIVINDNWAKQLGYQKDEISPFVSSWEKLIHPDDKERVFASVDDLVNGVVSEYKCEYRLRQRTGTWLWIQDVGRIYQHGSDGCTCIIKGLHLDIHETRSLCDALDRSRADIKEIIDKFLDALIEVDGDVNVVRVSEQTSRLLGYSQDEIKGRPVTDFFEEPSDLIRYYFDFSSWRQSSEQKEWRNIRLTLRGSDGQHYPVTTNISRLRDIDGKDIGAVAGARNIADLHQSLSKLKQQQAFINNIFDVLPGGLLVLSSGFEFHQRNKTFEEMIIRWSNIYDIPISEMRTKVLDQLAACIDHAPNDVLTLKLPESDLHIEYRTSQTTLNGQLSRIIFIQDVTARQLLEKHLKIHSTAIRQIGDAIIITDARGVIEDVNQAALKMTGYQREELVGQRMSIFKSGRHDDLFYKQIWSSLLSGKSWAGEIKNYTKQKELFEVSSSITPVEMDDEGTMFFVSVWRDRRQELKLRRQLLHAQKMESVGRLAAGIAHEINTPIQYLHHNIDFLKGVFEQLLSRIEEIKKIAAHEDLSASSNTWQLLDKQLDTLDLEYLSAEVSSSVEDTLQGIGQIITIVSAMREFYHPGKGDSKSPCDINRIIKSTVVVTQNVWKYVATVELQLQPDLPYVDCLAGAMQQVLLNLINNSTQAIHEQQKGSTQPGTIHISTSVEGKFVLIRLADSGPGIAEQYQEQVFEPFFTTKEVGEGTGQGLAIAYDLIVSKHGGTIEYIPTDGSGAIFEIRLPLPEGTI